MARGIGELRGADEGLNHQLIETFATVVNPALSRTDKVWMALGKSDGSVTVDGETYDITPDERFVIRDHSWGIRQGADPGPRG